METSVARSIQAPEMTTFACRNCARRTEFEQPPCPDGHGADCPEWYCAECGSATLLGWSVVRGDRIPGSNSRAGRRHVA